MIQIRKHLSLTTVSESDWKNTETTKVEGVHAEMCEWLKPGASLCFLSWPLFVYPAAQSSLCVLDKRLAVTWVNDRTAAIKSQPKDRRKEINHVLTLVTILIQMFITSFSNVLFPLSYMNSLERISSQDYIPTEQDVLRVRFPTTGIHDYSFTIKTITLRWPNCRGHPVTATHLKPPSLCTRKSKNKQKPQQYWPLLGCFFLLTR